MWTGGMFRVIMLEIEDSAELMHECMNAGMREIEPACRQSDPISNQTIFKNYLESFLTNPALVFYSILS